MSVNNSIVFYFVAVWLWTQFIYYIRTKRKFPCLA